VADALVEAGFDGCDFASNHTLDRGLSGLADTRQVLADAGLQFAGPVAEAGKEVTPAVYDLDGATVAQLAYSYTAFNAGAPNTDVPGDAPWLRDYLWPAVGAEGILADARRAKEDGADFVVVSMHWGNEYWTEPTEQQRELARDLLESDAVDLVVGTHVHVIQPCEKLNGKYVLYGLGNFLSNQSPDTTRGNLRRETQEGMIAHVTLTRDEDGAVSSRMRFQPTRVQIDSHVIRLASPEQHAETYQRVVDTMSLLGEGSCDAEPIG
jgi:poly-gamma-glutamate capsule biosynthesis protein CapA/YwtB (metallophosphatase superfamily)